LKRPKQSPNLNAYSERFVQTIKNECTEKMIFLGKKHLEHVLSEFVAHYHVERPHQGLGPEQPPPVAGRICCRERLGGSSAVFRIFPRFSAPQMFRKAISASGIQHLARAHSTGS